MKLPVIDTKFTTLNGLHLCIITISETMIKGLNKVSWERVDVSFKGSRQRLLAHSTIQASNFLLLHLDLIIMK